MHRARLGLTDDQSRRFPAEFATGLEIHFVAIPTSLVSVHGKFHELLGSWCPPAPSADLTVIPIHEGQWQNLPALFPGITKLNEVRFAKAQTSVGPPPFFFFFSFSPLSPLSSLSLSPYSLSLSLSLKVNLFCGL